MSQGFTLQQDSVNAQQRFRLSDGIYEIFQDFLRPASSTSAAAVARALDNLVPQGDVDNFVWDTWNNVLQIAQQIPHNDAGQDKLVRVLRELTLLPDGGKGNWRQLPQLGWVLRDWFNFRPTREHVNSDDAEEVLRSWVNVNAFWAKLGGTGVHSTTDFALWTLRQVLEEDSGEASELKLVENGLLTAAQYVEHESHILYQQLALGWKPRQEEAQMFKGGSLFGGEPGLSNERWEFWISKFRELAEKTSAEDARSAALRAANLLAIKSDTQ